MAAAVASVVAAAAAAAAVVVVVRHHSLTTRDGTCICFNSVYAVALLVRKSSYIIY